MTVTRLRNRLDRGAPRTARGRTWPQARLARVLAACTCMLLCAACARQPSAAAPAAQPPAAAPAQGADTLAAAPWRAAALPSADVPRAYVDAWSRADNRATCALLAFAEPPQASRATVRAATFSGGWGVAYDLPEQRSAFGIAGTGVTASQETYDAWPFQRRWADGSTAGYGPEGGTGPNQLAYLRITGQGCLYNVWSRLGRPHLEQLLERIRFIGG